MERVNKEFLVELVEKKYNEVVEKIEKYKKDLETYQPIIDKMESLGILNSYSYNKVSKVKEDKISLTSATLEKYYISKNLLADLYNNGFDKSKIEKEVDETIHTIDKIYSFKNNTISLKTYGIFWLDDILQYKMRDKIIEISNIFNLNINKRIVLETIFIVGVNTIGDYKIKFYKNGKLEIKK